MTTVFEPQLMIVLERLDGFGVHDRARAERDIAAGRAGGRANRPIQQRRAQPVEKPPIKTAALQLTHRTRIAVRQDGLWTVG